MPYQPPSSAQNHLNNSIIGFTGVVNTLEVLTEAFRAPFLEPMSKTARSLLTLMQTVKQNQSDCSNLIEQTSNLLYAIISVYAKTLHKIHSYVEAQQDKSKIKQFFRQGELSTLFKACISGLQEALEVFKLADVNLLANVMDMQKYTEGKHQEVLQMIEALSEDVTSEQGSVLNINFYAPV
ncbi:hypothetical protein C8R43DRAFT_948272 [Mycena crocata]|nr:hypothetical protein C8R43DRAFT_948272 [Mycena crocata]